MCKNIYYSCNSDIKKSLVLLPQMLPDIYELVTGHWNKDSSHHLHKNSISRKLENRLSNIIIKMTRVCKALSAENIQNRQDSISPSPCKFCHSFHLSKIVRLHLTDKINFSPKESCCINNMMHWVKRSR